MQTLDLTGLNRLLRLVGAWNGLLVLNYHRIGEPDGSLFDWDLWSASGADFDGQVRFLARNFDLIGLNDLDDVLTRPQRGSRHVLITFDDGYRDNFDLAYPILKSHGALAAFFLTSGFLDRPRITWWDEIAWMVRSSKKSCLGENPCVGPLSFDEPTRQQAIKKLLRTYKQLPGESTDSFIEILAEATGSGRCPNSEASTMWMTRDMVREMHSGGMTFGAHTVNHPVLSSLTAEEQDLEICESRLRIEQEICQEVTAFSYPVGSKDAFNQDTRHCLTRHGIRWAFSFYGGFWRPGQLDAYDLPRVAMESDVTSPALRSVAALPQLFAD
ncbi:MAG: polysaccharide deacetylase [Planctomycetaceae bacterium]|nr:polysaccharide deacetylase [Planctomycetaceae bacterium]